MASATATRYGLSRGLLGLKYDKINIYDSFSFGGDTKSKCMEHILVSNIMQHLDSNKILYALQHGFRKNLSCDTQLLSLFQDLSSNPSQTDMIIMYFSKAYDKVPHRRLQYKLDWYVIRGSTHNWIQHFLQGRSQRVVSEGSQSSPSCPLWCAPRYCSWPDTISDIHQRPPRRSHQ